MAALPADELARRSTQAAGLLFAQPEFEQAETMMIYLSLPHEVETTAIVVRGWQEGKRVTAPQVLWESRQMIPVEIESLEDDVAESPLGIRQPIRGEPTPVSQIDLVIVPGLAFDGHGNRVGRGRGFYDRFLVRKEFRGVTCGLALEEQIVGEIETAPNDVRMKMVVTDRQVRRF